MTFYLKLNGDLIVDIISYPHPDFIEVNIDLPLPEGINSDMYRWDGSKPVLDEEVRQQRDLVIKNRRIEENQDLITEAQDLMLLDILERGLI